MITNQAPDPKNPYNPAGSDSKIRIRNNTGRH